jgi:hypothetical protein
MALMVDPDSPDRIIEAYGAGPERGAGHHVTHPHTIGDVFTALTRSNFRVDTLIEPEADTSYPASVVFRARKVGV